MGVKLFEENLTEIECLGSATNFGTRPKIAIIDFVRTIATMHLVMEGA